MTISNSTGLKNAKFTIGQRRALNGGVIELRTGASPGADNAATGTLLGILTSGGGAHTPEVQATGSVQLTAGGSGNTVTSITVNSIEILGATITYDTDLPTTAALIVAQINRYQTKSGIDFTASSNGTSTPTITITANLGAGTAPNGWVIASTVTGFTKVDTNMSGGVNSVNGLFYEGAVNGAIAPMVGQTWQLTWLAAGTLGHFRMKGPIADAGGASTTLIRKDGSIATSGGDMTVSSVTVTADMVGQTANLTSGTISEQ